MGEKRKRGRPANPANDNRQFIGLRLDNDTYNKIKARAILNGRSANAEMCFIISQAVNQ